MVAKLIDGYAVARQVCAECRELAQALTARGVTPGLAVIIVGDNAASMTLTMPVHNTVQSARRYVGPTYNKV